MRAVPMFEEWMNTSGTVSTRCCGVIIVDREACRSAARRGHRSVELMVTLPESSAIAVVSALKVEPISKTPTLMRLMRSVSSASTGLFGS